MTITIQKACDWCERSLEITVDGALVLTEIPPLTEGIDLERFQFCDYKCLTRWMNL